MPCLPLRRKRAVGSAGRWRNGGGIQSRLIIAPLQVHVLKKKSSRLQKKGGNEDGRTANHVAISE